MHYPLHDAFKNGLRSYFNAVASTISAQQTIFRMSSALILPQATADGINRTYDAAREMAERAARDYPKPDYRIKTTNIGGDEVSVTEKVIDKKPFCDLLRFARDTKRNDPKVLVVAPMSGHYATLMRRMVEGLLPAHDVYITDWKNARDVPKSDGDFGLDDYIGYVQDFMKTLGPNVHVIGLSQSTVPVLAGVSLMSARGNGRHAPASMTLFTGPIDTRAARTPVTDFADRQTRSSIAATLIGEVPETYKGAGRRVYPGFMQLAALMSVNPQQHFTSHVDMFNAMARGDHDRADQIKAFYDEYLSMCDLTETFFQDTVERVFHKHELPNGTMTWKGQKVDPAAIRKTALFTIEGGRDDTTAPGQTEAAQHLCKSLNSWKKFHHLQPEAGHYDIFNGPGWRRDVLPRVTGFIRAIAQGNGIAYDPVPATTDGTGTTPGKIAPTPWNPAKSRINHKYSISRGANNNDGPVNHNERRAAP